MLGKGEPPKGLELTRLQSPRPEDINEDFLCAICKSKFSVPDRA